MGLEVCARAKMKLVRYPSYFLVNLLQEIIGKFLVFLTAACYRLAKIKFITVAHCQMVSN